jgi:hypothetical protein
MSTQKPRTPVQPESLDDFLASEVPSTECLFIVESVDDQPTKVKLTPAVSGEGCLCDWSLTIDKAHISGVTRYATKACCGHEHEIVRVTFKKDAVLSLPDIFSQLQQNIRDRRLKPEDRLHVLPLLPPFPPTNNYSGGGSGDGDTSACVYVAGKLYRKALKKCDELPLDQQGLCQGLALYNYGEAYTLCNVSW